MPAINVPAAPAKAVFMNALRDRTLSCGLINGCRLYQISVCLEPESVPPGNHRVPDCYLVNVTPLEPGEEFPRVHGDDRFFYAKTFATCSSKRGSTVGGMAAHRRLHRRRVYRLVDDSDNVRSGRQRSITVGRRCNSNTPLAISGPVEELVKVCVHGLKQWAECLYPAIFIDSPFRV